MSSMQSIDSEFGGLTDASIQSDMPRRSKKKRSIMGRLRASLSRGRGSDSDVSVSKMIVVNIDLLVNFFLYFYRDMVVKLI